MAPQNISRRFPSFVGDTSKECTRCGIVQPFSNFHKRPKGTKNCASQCKKCKNIYHREYQRGRPRWKTTLSGRQYYAKHKDAIKAKQEASRREVKRQVIAAYGGMCACCGETEPEFLTIDHIDGLGHKYRNGRRNAISGDGYYRRLRNQGFPKDNHQLLCWNCNCAKGYFRQCPHIKRRAEILNY